MKNISTFIGSVTMYRLTLYSLALISIISVIELAAKDISTLPWTITSILTLSTVTTFASAYFSKITSSSLQIPSAYITMFILFLIMPVPSSLLQLLTLSILPILVLFVKYILTFNKRHFLNPAAAAGLISGLLFGTWADWWGVTSWSSIILISILGTVIAYKTGRVKESALTILSFFIVMAAMSGKINPLDHTHFPILFFTLFMITEPLTEISNRRYRLIASPILGLAFALACSNIMLFVTPEMLIIAYNLLAFTLHPNRSAILTLQSKRILTSETTEYIWSTDRKISATPGQYGEFTLGIPPSKSDSRDNRRTLSFTNISPNQLSFAVKHPPKDESKWKSHLTAIPLGTKATLSNIGGDFTFDNISPHDKILCIAGGIGVTPFICNLRNSKRDFTLVYAAKNFSTVSFKEELAISKNNIKYILANNYDAPQNFPHTKGFIDQENISLIIKDSDPKHVFISGAPSMVTSVKKLLSSYKNIKVHSDFFDGY